MLERPSLQQRREQFHRRTARYIDGGHDRLAAADFVAEGAGEAHESEEALDIGTGKGLLAMALARRGFRVATVDVDEEEQTLAASLAVEAGLSERITFARTDAVRLPHADGRFAVVATMNALHHFNDGAAVLREMLRVLRPGGRLVLAEFTEEGFDLVERVHSEEGRAHPRSALSLEWASGFLAAAGLAPGKGEERHLEDRRIFRKARVPASGQAIPRGRGEQQFSAAGAGNRGGSPFDAMDETALRNALMVFAKNWLAHDGTWFLAAEERYGLEAAMDLDAASWARFAAVEARRICDEFGLSRHGGLPALERALNHRMYALLNRQRTEWDEDGRVLRFFMERCRVQDARRRKGLPDFPCKPVGQVEFSTFARTVDPSIEARCLHCPPDPGGPEACAWEFRLNPSARPAD